LHLASPGPATSVSATGGVGVIVISDEQGAQHFLEIKRHGTREILPGQATISIDGRLSSQPSRRVSGRSSTCALVQRVCVVGEYTLWHVPQAWWEPRNEDATP
jgi:hypothetical protein